MKKLTLSLFTLIVLFSNCSDDDNKKKSAGLKGSWEITEAVGVEWEEDEDLAGTGKVINTNDPDPDFMGEVFEISNSEIAIKGSDFAYEYSNGVLTLDMGGGESEVFNVVINGNSMLWTQDEPSQHSDYEYNDGSESYLYYQKSFTFEKR